MLRFITNSLINNKKNSTNKKMKGDLIIAPSSTGDTNQVKIERNKIDQISGSFFFFESTSC